MNGSQTAAPFILESGKAVIAMGGFGGTDPAPTLSQFEQLVATGKVHYVYVSSGREPPVVRRRPAPGRRNGVARSTTGCGTAGSATGESGRSADSAAHAVGGQTTTTASAVDSWVEKHGTVVSSSAYGGSSGSGTLYYVSSSAATK